METTLASILLFVVILMLCALMVYLLNTKRLVDYEKKNEDIIDKKKNIFPFLFSIMAMIVSIIALAFVLPRTSDNLSMNYWDVITGILATLITVLLGWQIYNSLRIEEHARNAADAARYTTKAARNADNAEKQASAAAEIAKQSKEDMDESRVALSDYIEKQNRKIQDLITEANKQLGEIEKHSNQMEETINSLIPKIEKLESLSKNAVYFENDGPEDNGPEDKGPEDNK